MSAYRGSGPGHEVPREEVKAPFWRRSRALRLAVGPAIIVPAVALVLAYRAGMHRLLHRLLGYGEESCSYGTMLCVWLVPVALGGLFAYILMIRDRSTWK